MKIKKELKNATFEYDEEKKSFTISREHPPLRGICNTVELNKVYAFAFMRFVIRMAQRNWFRKVTKENPNTSTSLPEEELIQLAFNLEENDEDYPELPKEKLEELLEGVKIEFPKGENLPF
jgi:hypothetical protein